MQKPKQRPWDNESHDWINGQPKSKCRASPFNVKKLCEQEIKILIGWFQQMQIQQAVVKSNLSESLRIENKHDEISIVGIEGRRVEVACCYVCFASEWGVIFKRLYGNCSSLWNACGDGSVPVQPWSITLRIRLMITSIFVTVGKKTLCFTRLSMFLSKYCSYVIISTSLKDFLHFTLGKHT